MNVLDVIAEHGDGLPGMLLEVHKDVESQASGMQGRRGSDPAWPRCLSNEFKICAIIEYLFLC